MTVVVVLVALVGVVVMLKRSRRRRGASIVRTFNVEPPAGRLGRLKGERL